MNCNDYGLRSFPKLIYENPLGKMEDIKNFQMEGDAKVTFDKGCMRITSLRSPQEGQKANYVYWCREEFPPDILITWQFRPVEEPGLAMMFFSARGKDGSSLFAPHLAPRTGEYDCYHHGDINTFHLSYFRRKEEGERAFHTCNLRKSYGLFLAAQGADPIPDACECKDFFQMAIVKNGPFLRFYINKLLILSFYDDGKKYGNLLGGGCMGFRQLSPSVCEYRELKVYELNEIKMGQIGDK